MPRYFFHILDGTALTDETGVELADLAAARIEAVKLVAGVLRGGVLPGFWDGEVWQLVVTDSPSPRAGRAYLVLSFSANSPCSQSRESAVTSGYETLAQVLATAPTPPQPK